MLSCARARSCSVFQGELATPITGTCRCARRAAEYRAGKIFLKARSPLAPNSTRASDLARFIGMSQHRLAVGAEASTDCPMGKNPVRETAPRDLVQTLHQARLSPG